VGKTQELGPLILDLQPHEVVLRFLAAEDIYLAVPPSLEDDLAALVAGNAPAFEGKTMVFDLTGTRGLSSRHLGILVTAQKALRSCGGCVLRGVSPDLRYQLEVTQIAQLFTLEDS